jgi:hypothetical protein
LPAFLACLAISEWEQGRIPGGKMIWRGAAEELHNAQPLFGPAVGTRLGELDKGGLSNINDTFPTDRSGIGGVAKS